jgi:hypothetical protein
MYTYIVYYDIQKDDGTWLYNQEYTCKFHRKGMHDRASRELEEYIGSFNNFRINKITCD